MQIDAKPAETCDSIRRVADLILSVQPQPAFSECRQHRGFNLFSGERRGFNVPHHPIAGDRRRDTTHQQQVTSLFSDQSRQPALQPRIRRWHGFIHRFETSRLALFYYHPTLSRANGMLELASGEHSNLGV
jgi:hypothetical protein